MSNLKTYIKKGYDPEFLSRVQPQGGMNIKSWYIEYGDGCATCVVVTGYPTSGLSNMYLKSLLQQPQVIGFQSTESFESEKIAEAANKSINEKESRINPNANNTDNIKENKEIIDLYDLVDDVTRKNEAMKGISIRLWVYDLTPELLAAQVKKVRDGMSQFKAEVLLDELEMQIESIYTRPNKQKKIIGGRPNRPIKSYDLAGGYYYDHEKLEDPHGTLFGKTATNGAVIFDYFKNDPNRTNSFMLVSGTPKMGQGTFVTALLDNAFAEGHYIRNIKTDTKPHLNAYTENNAGLVVELSGGSNLINPFHIFPAASDKTGQVDEIKSFRLHLAKLKNLYEALTPSATDNHFRVFRSLVRGFYCQYPNENDPLWYLNPKRHLDKLKATKIPYEDYPKLSNFISFVESARITERDPDIKSIMFSIKETFEELLQSQPDMFEGTTNPAFKGLSDEHLVTYDLSGLVGQPEYLNAQLFSVLALISYDVVENGKRQRDRLQKHPRMLESDVDQIVVNITNISQLLSPRYPSASELMNELVESLSQNYAGVIVQAPNVQALLARAGTGEGDKRHYIAMNALFDKMTYRVFAQLGVNDKNLLEEVLKEELGQHELNAITNFEQRQLYLGIHGRRGIIFTQEYEAEDLAEYGGWH